MPGLRNKQAWRRTGTEQPREDSPDPLTHPRAPLHFIRCRATYFEHDTVTALQYRVLFAAAAACTRRACRMSLYSSTSTPWSHPQQSKSPRDELVPWAATRLTRRTSSRREAGHWHTWTRRTIKRRASVVLSYLPGSYEQDNVRDAILPTT
ncbi:hypothetical protein K466DRAFT_406484 [Polyporus arcularius HHB13444]|uniref:Uncharacterized protein n=1 Tax=Polyporus arcularius HHB13444 TaxID=1314778 RepID=A0A5C3P2A5_9APHY|nr:hypothetical protein K466DRAFT_406484 [Polyporus arcularius HHB13444]